MVQHVRRPLGMEQLASLGSMGEVLWVSIEAAGIGRVRQIADTMEQVRRLAGNQHDGPSRAKAHDFIGRQQRAALQMLPGAAGRAARLRRTVVYHQLVIAPGGFPARAGMDPIKQTSAKAALRLPRPRGDGPVAESPAAAGSKASSPARGWTRGYWQALGCHRGFPARAGMDPMQRPASCGPHRLPRPRGDGPDGNERPGR
jgi:hypothetical protein